MLKTAVSIVAALTWAIVAGPVWAQVDELIEIDTGRTEGVFSRKPVLLRAILARPAAPAEIALLMFRGSPGYARIESLSDKRRNIQPYIARNERLFMEAGIALVVMDCPTDQWGEYGGPGPTNCFDDYRASLAHAGDVRSIIARLRERGFTRFFVLGHSQGTLSSRWIARHLDKELAGSIHSSSINVPNPRGYARTMPGFDYGTITHPVAHFHHISDACSGTPYDLVKSYAGSNLVTVRGGGPVKGNPCALDHYHAYVGREDMVARAMVNWIKTGQVERFIGE